MRKKEIADSQALESEGASSMPYGDPASWGWMDRLGLGVRLLKDQPFLTFVLVLSLGIGLSLPTLPPLCEVPPWTGSIPMLLLFSFLTSTLTAFWGAWALQADRFRAPGLWGLIRAWLGTLTLMGALTLVVLLGLLLPISASAYNDGALLISFVGSLLALAIYRLGAFAIPHIFASGSSAREGASVSWHLTGSLTEGWFFPGLLGLFLLAGVSGLQMAGDAVGGPGGFVFAQLAVAFLLLWGHLVWMVHFLHLSKLESPSRDSFRFGFLDLVIGSVLYGVLFLFALPNFTTAYSAASKRVRKCFSNQMTIAGAIEMYNLDLDTDLRKLDEETRKKLIAEGYLEAFPDDPGFPPGTGWHYVMVPAAGNGITCIKHGPIQDGQDAWGEAVEARYPRAVLEAGGVTDEFLLRNAAWRRDEAEGRTAKTIGYQGMTELVLGTGIFPLSSPLLWSILLKPIPSETRAANR